MWDKIKIALFTFGLGALAVAGIFIFGRRGSDGGGVSVDNERSDDIRSGIDDSQRDNKEAGAEVRAGISDLGKSGQHISNAQTQLRSAIRILKEAKSKNKTIVD